MVMIMINNKLMTKVKNLFLNYAYKVVNVSMTY